MSKQINNQKEKKLTLNFGVIFETPLRDKVVIPLSVNMDNKRELNNLKTYMGYSIKKHVVIERIIKNRNYNAKRANEYRKIKGV